MLLHSNTCKENRYDPTVGRSAVRDAMASQFPAIIWLFINFLLRECALFSC
jgi:hypothetical protein